MNGNGMCYTTCAIALDANKNAYIVGTTNELDMPVTIGPHYHGSNYELAYFVAKFNPTLSGSQSLVYARYLSDTTNYTSHLGDSIAVDAVGEATIAGYTNDAHFPTTPGAFQTTYIQPNYHVHGFLSKFNQTGQLLYSSLLEGGADEQAYGVAIPAGVV